MSGSISAGGVHDVGGSGASSRLQEKLAMTNRGDDKATHQETLPNLNDPEVAKLVKDKPQKHWEMQIHAILVVLSCRSPSPLLTTDELRRGVEALDEHIYNSWTYYERWAASMTNILIERGVINQREFEMELAADEGTETLSEEPKFRSGDCVRVKREDTRCRWRKPHLRTPGYIYGCVGRIERYCGQFADPYYLAFRAPAPAQHLYRVRFLQRHVWPEYDKSSDDTVDVEVYEGWLTAASLEEAQQAESPLDYHPAPQAPHSGHDDHHHHEHEHDHDHDHPHEHEARVTVETNAIVKEGLPSPGQLIAEALLRLLVKKEIISLPQINQTIARMEEGHDKLLGAYLASRAWVDPDFKRRLLSNAGEAAMDLGIVTSNPNAPTILTVVENTPEVHNVIVCTLCSCYPSAILGFSPSWYKSRVYRSRVVREPRNVLAEFGTEIPPSVRIQVHDSTADNRYMVLPMRPQGTDGWSEEALRELITRDSMIGVTLPHSPKK